MPKLKSLRRSAIELINSTRKLLPLGAANRRLDACSPDQMSSMRAELEIKACFRGFTREAHSEEIINLLAETAKKHRCGNCQAQAAVAYQLVQELSPVYLDTLTMASFEGGDHSFIVFNPESGKELLVCPWSGVIGERDEFICKLKVDGELSDSAYGTGEVLMDDRLTKIIKSNRVSTETMLCSLMESNERALRLTIVEADRGAELGFEGKGSGVGNCRSFVAARCFSQVVSNSALDSSDDAADDELIGDRWVVASAAPHATHGHHVGTAQSSPFELLHVIWSQRNKSILHREQFDSMAGVVLSPQGGSVGVG